jgi:hypothetical protein
MHVGSWLKLKKARLSLSQHEKVFAERWSKVDGSPLEARTDSYARSELWSLAVIRVSPKSRKLWPSKKLLAVIRQGHTNLFAHTTLLGGWSGLSPCHFIRLLLQKNGRLNWITNNCRTHHTSITQPQLHLYRDQHIVPLWHCPLLYNIGGSELPLG